MKFKRNHLAFTILLSALSIVTVPIITSCNSTTETSTLVKNDAVTKSQDQNITDTTNNEKVNGDQIDNTIKPNPPIIENSKPNPPAIETHKLVSITFYKNKVRSLASEVENIDQLKTKLNHLTTNVLSNEIYLINTVDIKSKDISLEISNNVNNIVFTLTLNNQNYSFNDDSEAVVSSDKRTSTFVIKDLSYKENIDISKPITKPEVEEVIKPSIPKEETEIITPAFSVEILESKLDKSKITYNVTDKEILSAIKLINPTSITNDLDEIKFDITRDLDKGKIAVNIFLRTTSSTGGYDQLKAFKDKHLETIEFSGFETFSSEQLIEERTFRIGVSNDVYANDDINKYQDEYYEKTFAGTAWVVSAWNKDGLEKGPLNKALIATNSHVSKPVLTNMLRDRVDVSNRYDQHKKYEDKLNAHYWNNEFDLSHNVYLRKTANNKATTLQLDKVSIAIDYSKLNPQYFKDIDPSINAKHANELFNLPVYQNVAVGNTSNHLAVDMTLFEIDINEKSTHMFDFWKQRPTKFRRFSSFDARSAGWNDQSQYKFKTNMIGYPNADTMIQKPNWDAEKANTDKYGFYKSDYTKANDFRLVNREEIRRNRIFLSKDHSRMEEASVFYSLEMTVSTNKVSQSKRTPSGISGSGIYDKNLNLIAILNAGQNYRDDSIVLSTKLDVKPISSNTIWSNYYDNSTSVYNYDLLFSNESYSFKSVIKNKSKKHANIIENNPITSYEQLLKIAH